MKKQSVIFSLILFFGILLLLASAFLPFLVAELADLEGEVGLFGNAIIKTQFGEFRRALNELFGVSPLIYYSFIFFGIAFLITGSFGLIFKKTVADNCSLKTSFLAFAIGIIANFAVATCGVSLLFKSPQREPYEIIGYSALLLLAVLLVIILFAFYCVQRAKKPSAKGVAIDIAFVLIFLPAWFYFFLEFGNWVYALLALLGFK